MCDKLMTNILSFKTLKKLICLTHFSPPTTATVVHDFSIPLIASQLLHKGNCTFISPFT